MSRQKNISFRTCIVIRQKDVILHEMLNFHMKQTEELSEDTSRVAAFLHFCKRKKIFLAVVCVCVVLSGCLFSALFCPFSTKDETACLYIDNDDDIDSVYAKIERTLSPGSMSAFKLLSSLFSYDSNVHTGRYEISAKASVISVFRILEGGRQSPVRIVVPPTWTKEMALGRIAGKLMTDSSSLVRTFNDPEVCGEYNLDTNTVVSVLIPNTYEVYWNISPEDFLRKMYNESRKFWTEERLDKARAMNLNTIEVLILASIVDAETANSKEKPIIAGVYVNRLRKGMPLQSCPTVKYALGEFGLHRVYEKMLRTPSPYNTYIHTGLPPSPIRIPTVDGIDAVLNYTKHNFLYMCAKEDLSGTHNFAASYSEHSVNARKYAKAMDGRRIR